MGLSLRDGFAELKRRKVYHVGAAYAVAAFVVWQVADIAFPSLGLPESAVTVVLVLTVLGFPLALVLAWAYEVRPELPPAAGGRRTRATTAGRSATSGRWATCSRSRMRSSSD